MLQNRFKLFLSFILAIFIAFSQPSFAWVQSETNNSQEQEQTEQSSSNEEDEDAEEQDEEETEDAEQGDEETDEEAAEENEDDAETAAVDEGSDESKTQASSSEKSSVSPQNDNEDTVTSQALKTIVYYIFLFIIISAVVAIFNRIFSIYKLTQVMNGKYSYIKENSIQAVLLIVFLILFLAGVYYSYAVWGKWSFRKAATEHGQNIDSMFIVTTVLTTIVLVLMHILLLGFSYVYRLKPNRRASFYPHNNTLEIIWTVVPFVVLTSLIIYGSVIWKRIFDVPEDLKNSAIQIEVLGEQFSWQVRYPGPDGEFGKRNFKLTTPTNSYGIDFNDKKAWDDLRASDIVIPVNRPVRFHILSKDIIHSFYIPDFRVQMNAVPGMTNYFQFTPTMTTEEMREKMDDPEYDFIMLCAKICGTGHYNMQKKVVVVTETEYQQWLNEQNKFFTDDMKKEFSVNENIDKDDSKESATASLN